MYSRVIFLILLSTFCIFAKDKFIIYFEECKWRGYDTPTLKTALPQNYIIEIYTIQISQYLKMPNKVHRSLDGNRGNLTCRRSPCQKVHFFKPTPKTIF